MTYIQEFDGNVKAKGVQCDTLFYEQKATKGLSFVIANDTAKVVSYVGTSKHVYIPDYWKGYAVTEIDTSAFEGTAIVSVRLPKYLETIGASAFKDCTALEEIDLGEHILSIGDFAFNGCSSLFKVIIRNADLPTVGQSNFGFVNGAVLVRPAKVNDDEAWENFIVGNDFIEDFAYFNGVAEASNTARNALMTGFTNAQFAQYAIGDTVVLPAGTYQIYAIVANQVVTSTVVYFDGTHKTSQQTPFRFADVGLDKSFLYDNLFIVVVEATGELFCTLQAPEGASKYGTFFYRKIN